MYCVERIVNKSQIMIKPVDYINHLINSICNSKRGVGILGST
nr:MAG TPA: hypothetical protein [Caudoviricetes sp.]